MFFSNFYMAKKNRITVSQVMAILALLGICLSVVGTTWLGQQSIPQPTPPGPLVSGEEIVKN
jgi:hypothetical protein